MRQTGNIQDIVKKPIDYIGFIFYPHSKRYIHDLEISSISIPSHIKKVGVFVNESNKKIIDLAEKHALDLIQLHGNESADDCAFIQRKGYKVIKVFGIYDGFEWQILDPYENHVDYFLFDTQSKQYGGTGKTFNWDLLKSYTLHIPYFLSGGISYENFNEALCLNDDRLYALDINSKFEKEPGLKNIELIGKILEYKQK
ncbi:MAG TPA: phosphoribosylanthranilate isomerase [Sphingobacterium sp.]|nr:phosphoribosylanthranilate isomerase [Sphingobacterium sp.]